MASCYYNMLPITNLVSLSTIEEEDISSRINHVKKAAKATYFGVILCLSWNLIAVATLWIHNGIQTKTLYLAIAYLLLGAPAAYSTWHRELGLAFRGEYGFNFYRFLAFYLFHIVFCWFASVNPLLEKSLAGFGSALVIYVFDDLAIVGVMYFIGHAFFFFECLISIRVLRNVHKLHRQGAFGLIDDALPSKL